MLHGPRYINPGTCKFSVWAPRSKDVKLLLKSPREESIPMEKQTRGSWEIEVPGLPAGSRYFYEVDGKTRPDPASHYQPEGVHGPSEVIDHDSFQWKDQDWKNLPQEDLIFYELHAGTFTPEGTYEAIINTLDYLKETGINALSLMPVAQCPGERNWGYDGAYPYAPSYANGGPEGLKKLVNACHQKGLAIFLDVVYNHMGPEGNYLADFGPYFTNQYHTFWGDAINFDDQYSDPVRQYFIQNALYWLGTYHFDGLRLDAVHAIYDYGAKHVLKEMAEEVAKLSYNLGQKKYLIAESGLNDSKIIRPFDDGGYGLDGQWSDDFHHALHALLTGEKEGYYLDFGEKAHLEKAFQKAFVYTWQYSPFRKKHFGNETEGTHPIQYLAYIQNHDQTGNRLFGERISSLVSYEALKLAAATVILSPYLPMIFMGEEYGEDQPFQYFIHHGDKKLVQAVREGRKNEFKDFDWKEEPPDPQSIETFNRSKLQWDKLPKDGHHQLYQLYKHLIRLRKEHFPGKGTEFNMVSSITAKPGEKILVLKRECKTEAFLYFIGLNDVHLTFEINKPAGRWEKLLDTAEEQWKGEGASMPGIIENDEKLSIQQYNFAIYKKET